MKKTLLVLIIALTVYSVSAAGESVVLSAAKKELARTMKELGSQQYPPYFLSYNITETQAVKINASFGKIETENQVKDRILDIDLRVGSPKFDNTHIIRGAGFSFGSGRASVDLPLEDDYSSVLSSI